MQRRQKLWVAMFTIMLVAASAVAWAAEELYEGYRVVRVLVNGTQIQSPVPAINFKGSTLIPLRAAVEAMGAELKWDGGTYTATIITPQKTSTDDGGAVRTENQTLKTQLATAQNELRATRTELDGLKTKLTEVQRSLDEANKQLYPPISEQGRGRSNPMPTGQAVTASLVQRGLNFTARFTLTEVVRGDQAWQRIQAANQFNDPPESGYEYVLVKLKAELLSVTDPEAAVDFDGFWFTVVSGSGRDYSRVIVVEPKPQFGTKMYRGASDEGYMVFAVASTDTAPLITFARDSQGKNGYWMELRTQAPAASPAPSQPTTTAPTTGGSGSTGSPTTTPVTVPKVTVPAHVNTPSALATYLNNNYGAVSTPTGTLKLNYDILTNDRTYMPYDAWIQIEYDPTLYFVDLATKVGISEADKKTSTERLRQHAVTVYAVAAAALPGKKVKGGYYDSWYRYPTIQAGFEARRYFSWQNYADNFSATGDPYTNAKLTEFHFAPHWDDIKF